FLVDARFAFPPKIPVPQPPEPQNQPRLGKRDINVRCAHGLDASIGVRTWFSAILEKPLIREGDRSIRSHRILGSLIEAAHHTHGQVVPALPKCFQMPKVLDRWPGTGDRLRVLPHACPPAATAPHNLPMPSMSSGALDRLERRQP